MRPSTRSGETPAVRSSGSKVKAKVAITPAPKPCSSAPALGRSVSCAGISCAPSSPATCASASGNSEPSSAPSALPSAAMPSASSP